MTTHRRAVAADDFRQWVEPLLKPSAAYAFVLLGNRADAEDAVQEAALKAYRKSADFDYSRSFRGWWFAILRNCCRDLRRRSRPARHVNSLDEQLAVQVAADLAGQKEELRRALGRLSEDHREILELRYFGECSYRDLAATLGIPEGTVMSRLHAARKALAATYRRLHHDAD
jgi:RNA polymerase sigma-70 factor (ECF subfamily)